MHVWIQTEWREWRERRLISPLFPSSGGTSDVKLRSTTSATIHTFRCLLNFLFCPHTFHQSSTRPHTSLIQIDRKEKNKKLNTSSYPLFKEYVFSKKWQRKRRIILQWWWRWLFLQVLRDKLSGMNMILYIWWDNMICMKTDGAVTHTFFFFFFINTSFQTNQLIKTNWWRAILLYTVLMYVHIGQSLLCPRLLHRRPWTCKFQ